MTSPTRIVLVACGSFNPITNMHLRMFELARDALHRSGRFQVIGGIISPVSDAYNKKELVTAKHRCAMIRLALKTSEWIRLESWESEQEVWSTTLKVLHHHRDQLESIYNDNLPDTPTKRRRLETVESINSQYNQQRQQSSTQIKLLCGADLLESFRVPGLWKDKDIEEILSQFGLVCISRSGSNADKFIYEHDTLSKYQNNIFLVTEWINNDISSTKIRRALRRGESVKYLVQDSVIDYVKTHNLYGAGENPECCRMYESLAREQASQCDYSPTWPATPGDESPKRKSPLKFFQRFNWYAASQAMSLMSPPPRPIPPQNAYSKAARLGS